MGAATQLLEKFGSFSSTNHYTLFLPSIDFYGSDFFYLTLSVQGECPFAFRQGLRSTRGQLSLGKLGSYYVA